MTITIVQVCPIQYQGNSLTQDTGEKEGKTGREGKDEGERESEI